ncbi:hypothetical protein So717_20740 [Roseobacter cerasinus]|uniref:Dihydroorotate dehydrogenase n=2 Tax=Roseobacter cerasinus TaxID=2602289 RepID=A0A640VTA9_9RHOB|nr:hypothetical protein So717_20740 [Roseobacter cerasinus]
MAKDRAVDAALDAARASPPPVPAHLMTRVLADAEAARPAVRDRSGFGVCVSELMGGWQGVGGLVAATLAGVWFGFSPPEAMPDAGALILGYENVELLTSSAELTSFGWDLDGG